MAAKCEFAESILTIQSKLEIRFNSSESFNFPAIEMTPSNLAARASNFFISLIPPPKRKILNSLKEISLEITSSIKSNGYILD